jgi:hypothetical protein
MADRATRPDQGAPCTWTAAKAVERVAELADLTRIFAPETQVCLHPRRPPAGFPEALATLQAQGWSGLRRVVRLDADGAPDPAALTVPLLADHPVLVQDLTFLMELYGELLGCPLIGLRVESLNRAMCPGWHLDRTGIRLLCTWCGPGTEWLDDPGIDLGRLPGSAADTPASGQAQPCDILLLKGSAWQGNAGGGAIHRSPTPAPGAAPRLLVALDALWED